MEEIGNRVLFSPQLHQFVESIHFGNTYDGDKYMNCSINFTNDLGKAYFNNTINCIALLKVIDQISKGHPHLEIRNIIE